MGKLAEIIMNNSSSIMNNVDLREMEDKTVLLTGASGLLGIHFLACLKHASLAMTLPVKVIVVVNREPLRYVRELLDYEGTRIVQGDLADIDFCKSLPEADYIIHTASYGQPIRLMENPIQTLKLNSTATLALFEKLLPGGKFLFVSTSELYMGLTTPPFKETDIGTTNTNHPRSSYIEAKRCGEAVVNAYRAKGVDAKTGRLGLAYGPGTRSDDKRAISSFIQKAFNGELSLLDQGKATRAYCYVSDVVEIMWNILLRGTEPVYNVGGISRMTIAEIAQTIGRLMHVPVKFPAVSEVVNGAPDEVWLDMTKARTEFGKTNYVPVEEGLKQAIEWYKALYEEESS
jgi:UDP-glucuronate decarboxylase